MNYAALYQKLQDKPEIQPEDIGTGDIIGVRFPNVIHLLQVDSKDGLEIPAEIRMLYTRPEGTIYDLKSDGTLSQHKRPKTKNGGSFVPNLDYGKNGMGYHNADSLTMINESELGGLERSL